MESVKSKCCKCVPLIIASVKLKSDTSYKFGVVH
jgi:hypothetical protein